MNLREKVTQKWNMYKRNRYLRECEKMRPETEFMFARLREECERMGGDRCSMAPTVRLEIMEKACEEYRSMSRKQKNWVSTPARRMAVMVHKLQGVFPMEDFVLGCKFKNGAVKLYDMKPLIQINSVFAHFKEPPGTFGQVTVSPDGYALVWNEDIDLATEEVWVNGWPEWDANDLVTMELQIDPELLRQAIEHLKPCGLTPEDLAVMALESLIYPATRERTTAMLLECRDEHGSSKGNAFAEYVADSGKNVPEMRKNIREILLQFDSGLTEKSDIDGIVTDIIESVDWEDPTLARHDLKWIVENFYCSHYLYAGWC